MLFFNLFKKTLRKIMPDVRDRTNNERKKILNETEYDIVYRIGTPKDIIGAHIM